LRDYEDKDVWTYMGDGNDQPATMSSGATVLMTGEHLRELTLAYELVNKAPDGAADYNRTIWLLKSASELVQRAVNEMPFSLAATALKMIWARESIEITYRGLKEKSGG
jgi:hypothetical protein